CSSSRRPCARCWRADMSVAKARLLVLDDDAELAELIGELGQRADFEPAVTTHAAAFYEEPRRAAPGLVVLGLRMPGTDGSQVLTELAAGGYDGPTLLVSGMDQRTIAGAEQFGRNAGVNVAGHLQKPFTPEALLSRLSFARGSSD